MKDLKKTLLYYAKMKNAGWSKKDYLASKKNRMDAKEELFAWIITEYGYDKLPKVMQTNQDLFSDSPEYHHGFKEFDHGAELLVEKKFHIGKGYTPGIYFTIDEDEAIKYTEGFEECNKTPIDAFRVLTIKIDSKKSIDYLTLCKFNSALSNRDFGKIKDSKHYDDLMQIVSFTDQIRSPHLRYEFLDVITCPSILAVLFGYDYLVDLNHVIVLNRGVMAVRNYEYNRFLSASKKYRNFSNIEKIEEDENC